MFPGRGKICTVAFLEAFCRFHIFGVLIFFCILFVSNTAHMHFFCSFSSNASELSELSESEVPEF